MGSVSAALFWLLSHDWAHGEQMGTRKKEGRKEGGVVHILLKSVWICCDANFWIKTTTERLTVNRMTWAFRTQSASFLGKHHNRGFSKRRGTGLFNAQVTCPWFQRMRVGYKNAASARLRKPRNILNRSNLTYIQSKCEGIDCMVFPFQISQWALDQTAT